jgi:hypothetical protein
MRELPASVCPLVEGITPSELEEVMWVEDGELQRAVIESAFPHLSEEEVLEMLREYGY